MGTTYALPTANVIVRPTFKRLLVCNFQTTGKGRTNMTTSVKIFGKLLQMNKVSLLMHFDGIVVFQFASNGRHAAKFEITVEMARAIRTPAVSLLIKRV
jgi:hypothetical protein